MDKSRILYDARDVTNNGNSKPIYRVEKTFYSQSCIVVEVVFGADLTPFKQFDWWITDTTHVQYNSTNL